MIVLLNHQSDLDGIGSQAILKRYFHNQGAQLELKYALYPTFIERIQEVMALDPDEIVIADIGFNDSFNQVFPIFEAAMKKGIKIFWFDHHQVDEETQNRLKKTINLYKNDTTSCAAKIVFEHFLPNDSIAQEIAKFAYDADYNEKKFPIAQELQIVIANNRNDLTKLKKISDLLSKGLFEDKFIQDERIKALNEENEQIRNIKQNYEEFSIAKGKSLVLSYSNYSASKISRILEAKYPSKYLYFGLDERSDEVVIRSNFINCKALAKRFGGGGHFGRAGFSSNEILIIKNENDTKKIKINENFINKFIIAVKEEL